MRIVFCVFVREKKNVTSEHIRNKGLELNFGLSRFKLLYWENCPFFVRKTWSFYQIRQGEIERAAWHHKIRSKTECESRERTQVIYRNEISFLDFSFLYNFASFLRVRVVRGRCSSQGRDPCQFALQRQQKMAWHFDIVHRPLKIWLKIFKYF